MTCILFRVDAGPRIGLGHLARCASLAEAFIVASVEPVFLTATPDAVSAFVPHDVRPLVDAPYGAVDATATMQLATELGAAHVVVDGYEFQPDFVESLSAGIIVPLWIDDDGFSTRRAGYVLNHNFHANDMLYPAMPPDRRLVGGTYALLRDEFTVARRRSSRHRTAAHASPARVLITMGGADPADFTSHALDAIEPLADKLVVRAIVGRTNPRRIELAHRPTVLVDPPAMSEQMEWCDVAITAGGGTCMELSCIGVPALVVAIADNQRPIAAELERQGLMRSLGWHATVTAEDIRQALASLVDDPAAQQAMVKAQHEAVDGMGKRRVIERLGYGTTTTA